jgi:glutamine cyclotransferase
MYKGKLLANIFMTHQVAMINPETGSVEKILDFYNLHEEIAKKVGVKNYYQTGYGNCLNGIAYDESTNTLLMTGKNWPLVFHIELEENK